MQTTKIFTASKLNRNNEIERIYFKVDNDADFLVVKDIQKDYDKGIYLESAKKPVRVARKDIPNDVVLKSIYDYFIF